MSEVRVHLAGYLAEGEHVVLQPDYDSLKFDFDRVTAERDATRRQLETITADRDSEKLMKAKARIQRDVQTAKAIGLQQRLTAADERADHWRDIASEATCRAAGLNERADVLEGLVREVVALDPRGEFLGWALDGKIDAALKPAEGGGNE